MADVIAEYTPEIAAEDGSLWAPRACARKVGQHWEGWVEFIPMTPGDAPVRTPTETTQSAREGLKQWAAGLSLLYLKGALSRALTRPVVVSREGAPALFDGPAPVVEHADLSSRPLPHPLLDPYDVYEQGGEARLLDQLAALGTDHIRDIAVAYELVSPESALVKTRGELVAHVLSSARTEHYMAAGAEQPARHSS